MKKKLFTLLTLLVAVCSGAWAQTELYSAVCTATSDVSFGTGTTEITTNATITGGKMYIISGQSDSKKLMTSKGFSMTNNNTYFKVVLDNALQAGDKIQSTYTGGTREKNSVTYELGIKVSSTNYTDGNAGDHDCSATSSSTTQDGSTLEYTVVSGDEYIGKTDLYIYRVYGATQYFNNFKVIRPAVETKCATPTVTLGAWDATANKYAVTLNCTTSGATIHYSTDSKISYTDYSTALALAPGTTLDAYATKTGLDASDAMEQYTVPAEPTFFTVTYANAEGATGVVPAAVADIEGGTSITLPKNFTMYKEGYTLTGWNDGTNTYAAGASYTVTATKTLTAVYTQNTVSLDDRTSAVTVKWWLGQQNGLPDFTISEGNTGFVVTQATVAGKTIDVQLPIDCSNNGKFHPGSNQWGQVNNGTVFTIPSANGAVISYHDYDNSVSPATKTVQTINVAVDGDTYTHTVNVSNHFYEYIQVVLPYELVAQDERFWDFSTWETGSFTSTKVSDELELVATSDNGMEIATNNSQTVGDKSFTKRLKLNGTGSSTARYIHFRVKPNTQISVYQFSGNADRKLKVDAGSFGGTNLLTEGNASYTKSTCRYTGAEETDIYVYSSDNNISIYGILVEEAPAAITITTQPASATYTVGGEADALTVTATPSVEVNALAYQWYSNTTASNVGGSEISEATTASYTPSTAEAGTFYYYCVVTEAAASLTAISNVATITVNEVVEAVEAPVFSVEGGQYYRGLQFNITCATEGATIYYKEDSKTHNDYTKITTSYTGTITYANATQKYISAYAEKGGVKSEITTVYYDVVALPDVSVNYATGTYNHPITVKYTNSLLPNGEILYRTKSGTSDPGSVTNTDAAMDGNGITVSETTRIKFKAWDTTGTKYGNQLDRTYTIAIPDNETYTTSASRYTTVTSGNALDFSNVEGLTAFIAKETPTGGQVKLTKVEKVPANTSFILYGAASTEYTIPVLTSGTTDDVDDNLLAGHVDFATTLTENAGYILSGGKFYPCSAGELAKGKCYLAVPYVQGARALEIIFDDDVITGIQNVNRETISNNRYYNLNGQSVAQPKKGLYIVNGRKVVLK